MKGLFIKDLEKGTNEIWLSLHGNINVFERIVPTDHEEETEANIMMLSRDFFEEMAAKGAIEITEIPVEVEVPKPLIEGDQHLILDVLNHDQLIDARENPEKYPQLTIRVSGYDGRFNSLNKEQHDDVISRTFTESL